MQKINFQHLLSTLVFFLCCTIFDTKTEVEDFDLDFPKRSNLDLTCFNDVMFAEALSEKYPHYLFTETFVVWHFQYYGNDFTSIITVHWKSTQFSVLSSSEQRFSPWHIVTVWNHSSDKISLPLATGQPSILTTPKTLNSIKHLWFQAEVL